MPLILIDDIADNFFYDIDPTNTILLIYGTISLTFLVRFFGSLFFGPLADIHGRKPIVIICILSMSIIMLLTGSLMPTIYDKTILNSSFENIPILVSLLFVLSRIGIGFFVGDVWPTAAVWALEKTFYNNRNKNIDWNDVIKKEVKGIDDKKLGKVLKIVDNYILIQGIINKKKFYIPKDAVESYDGNILIIKLKDLRDYQFEPSLIKLEDLYPDCYSKIQNNDNKINNEYRENIKNFKEKIDEYTINQYSFKKDTEKRTFYSSTLQLGFHFGVFMLFIIGIELWQFIDLPLDFLEEKWKILSFLGGVLGIGVSLLILFTKESTEFKINFKRYQSLIGNKKISSFGQIKRIIEYPEYRDNLLYLWLILAGLIYIYYSTIMMFPYVFKLNRIVDIGFIFSNDYIAILLIFTLIAHLWPGIYLSISKRKPIQFSKPEDTKIIFTISKIIIILSIITSIAFYLFFPDVNNDYRLKVDEHYSKIILIFITGIFLLFANAGWSLVPSMISSRFPLHLRSTASSLIYNSGLVIGFASPFISMEFFLFIKNEYLNAIPMILGGILMLYGAQKLYNMENEKLYKKQNNYLGLSFAKVIQNIKQILGFNNLN